MLYILVTFPRQYAQFLLKRKIQVNDAFKGVVSKNFFVVHVFTKKLLTDPALITELHTDLIKIIWKQTIADYPELSWSEQVKYDLEDGLVNYLSFSSRMRGYEQNSERKHFGKDWSLIRVMLKTWRVSQSC